MNTEGWSWFCTQLLDTTLRYPDCTTFFPTVVPPPSQLSQLLMKVRLPQPFPPPLPLPHQSNHRQKHHHMNNRKHPPGSPKRRLLRKRNHIKPQRKTKCLPSKVQERTDLRALRLIAIRHVRKHIRAVHLQSKCRDANPHDGTGPVRFSLEAHAFDYYA